MDIILHPVAIFPANQRWWKAYGIMAAGKAIIGVLEKDTEVRGLIEECHCGKCCEPGDYVEVADIIRWYIENADSNEVKQMGMNGRE